MIRSTEAITSATRYLEVADRVLPGRVVGFYVVGSVALGEFQHGRSDIDLHHTIVTGRVIAKEEAGRWARDVFPAVWHPLIDEALAYRHHHASADFRMLPAARGRLTAAFVLHVADAADAVVTADGAAP